MSTILTIGLLLLPLASTGTLAQVSQDSAASTRYDETERRNIDAMRHLFEAINGSTIPARDEALRGAVQRYSSPRLVRHDLTGQLPSAPGHDGALDLIGLLKAGFSDLHLEIQEILASDDRVVIRFITTGTHDGPFLGHAASAKRIRVNNVNIYKFENGLMVETWQLYDALTLMRQLDFPSMEPER